MTLDERYQAVLDRLDRYYPEANTELYYEDPFGLLVAVVLSAQCTDKRVNMVTPQLMSAYPTPQDMARASIEEVYPYISSISYPNSKAKHLVQLAQQLVEEYEGIVPNRREDLERLAGVGRKTASVILAVCFNTPAMPVDTHVFRVARRIGLASTQAKTPLEVERALVKRIPPDRLIRAHHQLILLGRYICQARKPLCRECPLGTNCRSQRLTKD